MNPKLNNKEKRDYVNNLNLDANTSPWKEGIPLDENSIFLFVLGVSNNKGFGSREYSLLQFILGPTNSMKNSYWLKSYPVW
jgi:hypothetical protein